MEQQNVTKKKACIIFTLSITAASGTTSKAYRKLTARSRIYSLHVQKSTFVNITFCSLQLEAPRLTSGKTRDTGHRLEC